MYFLIYNKKMSLIFDNYKFNEKYNFDYPHSNNQYKQTKNYEKQRKKLLENTYNENINANINYSPNIKNQNNNEYSNPNSPIIRSNNNYRNLYDDNK